MYLIVCPLATRSSSCFSGKATSSSKRLLISCELLMFLQQPGTLVPVILVCTRCICAYSTRHTPTYWRRVWVCVMVNTSHFRYAVSIGQACFTVGCFTVKQPICMPWLYRSIYRETLVRRLMAHAGTAIRYCNCVSVMTRLEGDWVYASGVGENVS